jgi:3-methylcrotonyl-CoA carboxylase alpha subunit
VIKKILIANRGEIAVRVIHTAHKMGIKTVTLYTPQEKHYPHVRFSDESYELPEGPFKENYLNQELLIEIAKKFNADAIHPGYGFLSENSKFVAKVEAAGIIFIGPRADSMILMGDKMGSKKALEGGNIPLIPGYHGDETDPKKLLEIAKKIGFPVLIKASAGGGGKGMRIVNQESEFLENLAGAQSEALKSFSDSRVLIERYLTKPRHIEVQVMSDTHGNHLHFFERECSIQRRYQKVIEETPSPALDADLRERICKTATEISSRINYRGAGTIEFILDENKNYYFLEMNTRLQVEHPVTEMVTGVDLVELQIRVAQGEKLNIKQSDIKQRGHSVECRLYAEDPANEFFPSIGKLKVLEYPSGPGLRVDYGYRQGNDVTVSFDPMLAKLIAWDTTREGSLKKMINMLKELRLIGVKSNRLFLMKVLAHPQFKKGDIDTNFIKAYKADLAEKYDDQFLSQISTIIMCEANTASTGNVVSGTEQSAWTNLNGFRN